MPLAGEGPEDNVLAKLTESVEEVKAPDTVRGTKFNNDNAANGVEFQHSHCTYLMRNTYVGGADGKDQQGWQHVI